MPYVCPMLSICFGDGLHSCIGEKCAWFNFDIYGCSVWNIATTLGENLEDMPKERKELEE